MTYGADWTEHRGLPCRRTAPATSTSISIRCGRAPTSMPSASMSTGRWRTGATARPISTIRPGGIDLRPRLSARQHRRRRGLRLVLPAAGHRQRGERGAHGAGRARRSPTAPTASRGSTSRRTIKDWWQNQHYNRPGGVESGTPTGWVPQSKPIWFTEVGCPAVDKGANQPNVFIDPKSSESFAPVFLARHAATT